MKFMFHHIYIHIRFKMKRVFSISHTTYFEWGPGKGHRMNDVD